MRRLTLRSTSDACDLSPSWVPPFLTSTSGFAFCLLLQLLLLALRVVLLRRLGVGIPRRRMGQPQLCEGFQGCHKGAVLLV